MNSQEAIHVQIVKNLPKLEAWFREKRQGLDVPFYSSYDMRDSGHKVVNVDANLYPAGFNNICPIDRENCGNSIGKYVANHYGPDAKKLIVLTEEHTNNAYYWDNVAALKRMIEDAGLEVRLAIPRGKPADGAHGPITMKSASNGDIEVHAAVIEDGLVTVHGYVPDLVVSNNDFSEYYAEWGSDLRANINPPRELGWYQRKKSAFFKHYNDLGAEFARILDLDPWMFTVETELFSHFDISDEEAKKQLAERVDAMIARIKANYEKRGIQDEPVVFVKNNSGTYGLAVMRVQSGADVMALNNKTRKKMKAAKGGRDVEEVILQEGVASVVKMDGVTAEPTIYLLGCQLGGGFLRAHAEKGPTESLNSPGAVYKRMCVSDLKISAEGNPLENVYGWIAKVALLAIGRESAEMGVKYVGYKR